MKISYKFLSSHIKSSHSIEEISSYLFQLGHEHEIDGDIVDLELTPNRGDCFSIKGILRELKPFFDINIESKIFRDKIKPLEINFENNSKNACPAISFMSLEIDKLPNSYNGPLKSYLEDLNIKSNNFFTDVSNYISYETGQPTHCYDSSSLGKNISLDYMDFNNMPFESLLDKTINLDGKNLVFKSDDELINLAGITGSKKTSCNNLTRSVIIECAYFNPEAIIGKSVKYDIKSEAAHKFERGVDPNCHEDVLRRFLQIVQDHSHITSLSIFTQENIEQNLVKIKCTHDSVNKILGTNIAFNQYQDCLNNLGFEIHDSVITVPSYRSDVQTKNDIAEEIARVIGYDNLPSKTINISNSAPASAINDESFIKDHLIKNGFSEVVNNPFSKINKEESIRVDNPLDANKPFIRHSLKESLIQNLLYNERRQKDSIKLFEISDIYYLDKNMKIKSKKMLGIIASGRVSLDYIGFSKKISDEYVLNCLNELFNKDEINIINIDRSSLDTKLKSHISFGEIQLDSFLSKERIKPKELQQKNLLLKLSNLIKYEAISEFPSSKRDLSFSIKDISKFKLLESLIMESLDNHLVKDVFVFDYYKNPETKVIKVGFRIIFQSIKRTINDNEVNSIINKLIDDSLKIPSIEMPGLGR